jgi:hypothetical protein
MHNHFQHRKTLTDFLSDPVPVFKDPCILDLPGNKGFFYGRSKRAAFVYFFAFPLPHSLTQHMHLILHKQTNNEMQEWVVVAVLYCVGSTVDLKRVHGQIVTARNCQEEDGFE